MGIGRRGLEHQEKSNITSCGGFCRRTESIEQTQIDHKGSSPEKFGVKQSSFRGDAKT